MTFVGSGWPHLVSAFASGLCALHCGAGAILALVAAREARCVDACCGRELTTHDGVLAVSVVGALVVLGLARRPRALGLGLLGGLAVAAGRLALPPALAEPAMAGGALLIVLGHLTCRLGANHPCCDEELCSPPTSDLSPDPAPAPS